MTLVWRPGFQFDADASTYIEAVEAADTQALETGVRYAINDFVIGCKNDGIWSAIKASCILAGARTLSGALLPLAGTAPTNVNFVSGDYNRKTGLVGNGSTKYLNSNRNNNADPQDSQHLCVYLGQSRTISFTGYMGSDATVSGASGLADSDVRSRNISAISVSAVGLGFVGVNRNSATVFTHRATGLSQSFSTSSVAPGSSIIEVFNVRGGGVRYTTNARLAFYSIGESLDLTKLDTRVSALITAIGAAIP
jgi:hypothetical protein